MNKGHNSCHVLCPALRGEEWKHMKGHRRLCTCKLFPLPGLGTVWQNRGGGRLSKHGRHALSPLPGALSRLVVTRTPAPTEPWVGITYAQPMAEPHNFFTIDLSTAAPCQRGGSSNKIHLPFRILDFQRTSTIWNLKIQVFCVWFLLKITLNINNTEI